MYTTSLSYVKCARQSSNSNLHPSPFIHTHTSENIHHSIKTVSLRFLPPPAPPPSIPPIPISATPTYVLANGWAVPTAQGWHMVAVSKSALAVVDPSLDTSDSGMVILIVPGPLPSVRWRFVVHEGTAVPP